MNLVDVLCYKDFLLGFFLALALRRDRIRVLVDRWLPGDS